jgi:DegV family protein with EDD domain
MLENVKIVADSSSDVLKMEGIPFASAPLKIVTAEKEYVDDENLDVAGMVEDMLRYTDKSGTACPSVGDWLAAFGGARYVFCVTITSNLSGSYNSAVVAAQEFEELHPGSRVLVIDTLSTGPEMKLILEKLRTLVEQGKEFDEIAAEIKAYQEHTGLLFMLESLRNLANNGRVSKVVASAAGIRGIRLLGRASDRGTLEPLVKSRGEKKALANFFQLLKKEGYCGGKVRVAHVLNAPLAAALKELILAEFPHAEIEIYPTRGLCSFYAEKGGMLVGFEKN